MNKRTIALLSGLAVTLMVAMAQAELSKAQNAKRVKAGSPPSSSATAPATTPRIDLKNMQMKGTLTRPPASPAPTSAYVAHCREAYDAIAAAREGQTPFVTIIQMVGELGGSGFLCHKVEPRSTLGGALDSGGRTRLGACIDAPRTDWPRTCPRLDNVHEVLVAANESLVESGFTWAVMMEDPPTPFPDAPPYLDMNTGESIPRNSENTRLLDLNDLGSIPYFLFQDNATSPEAVRVFRAIAGSEKNNGREVTLEALRFTRDSGGYIACTNYDIDRFCH